MRTCHKIAYATKHEARAAKRSCLTELQHGNSRRHERRLYRCPHCGSWHLTSEPHYEYDKESEWSG